MGQPVDHPVGKLHDGREAYVRVDRDGKAVAPAGPAQLPREGTGAPVISSRSQATSVVPCSGGSPSERIALCMAWVEWVGTSVTRGYSL